MRTPKLGAKLVGGFSVVALITAVVGFVGYSSLATLNGSIEKALSSDAISKELMQREIDHLVWVEQVAEAVDDVHATSVDVQKDDHKCGFGKWYYGEKREEAEAEVPAIRPLLAEIEKWHSGLHRSARTIEEMIQAGGGDRADVRHYFEQETRADFSQVQRILREMQPRVDEHAAEIAALSEAQARRSEFICLAGLMLGAVVALAIGIFLTRSITRPVKVLQEAAVRIAAGDVNQQVDHRSGDEIGVLAESFRGMMDYVKDIAGAADALNRNDRTYRIEPRSEQDSMSRSMIGIRDALFGIVDESRIVIEAAKGGRLDQRANTDGLKGVYAELVQGLNETMDAVQRPLGEAIVISEGLANRDLTARMTGSYEGDFARIRDSLNKAAESLDDGFTQVATGAQQVAAASEEIASGSQALAQGTSEQASSLEEVSSSLQEMASMTKQNAGNAKEAQTLAQGARSGAEKGMDSMGRLSGAMDRIKTSSDETAKIVKEIDEIAFQTNLLALNAAVEAARAGEAGKGFAVVAEEVRNLAIRSAESAKNTAEMIDESVKNAEDGVSLNEEVLQNLQVITGQISKVGDVMAEIAAASDEQDRGVDQITQAVEQMNQVTQQTASNSEESASAAEELSGQAETMLQLVGTFQLTHQQAGMKRPAVRKVPRGATTASAAPRFESSQEGENGGGRVEADAPAQFLPMGDDDQAALGEF